MPKIRPLTPKKLIAVLKKHGFVVNNITGSHYGLWNIKSGARVTIAYHNKDIPKGTLHAIIKASRLDISIFK